jgi:hypothetical protein
MSHSHLTEKKSMKFELRFRSLVWVKIEEISKLRCPRGPKAQVILTRPVASYLKKLQGSCCSYLIGNQCGKGDFVVQQTCG